MNIKQFRSICAVADHGLRISKAAEYLHLSQPSITRQVKELEEELGFDIFLRNQNKLLGITPQGNNLIAASRRILHEVENVRRMGREVFNTSEGPFNIATTHTHARYMLPQIIESFVKQYPLVQLSLRQGTPAQCCALVASGRADLAICSRIDDPPEGIIYIPCYRLSRSVITPVGHPLLRVKTLTLEALARYPLITYDEAYSGRQVVQETFLNNGLKPTIVLSAVDADVSKVYVAKGLGIAIFASIAFDPKRDVDLRRKESGNLFKPITLHLVLQRHSYLRQYMYDFMQLFAPKLSKRAIEETLSTRSGSATAVDHLPLL